MRLLIHEAAKRLGTTPRAIRFYEEKGLLAPHKSPDNGYRTFDADDLTTLRWIVALREIGLSVADLKALADGEALADGGLNDSRPVLAALEETRQRIYREWNRLSQSLSAFDGMLSAANARGSLTLVDAERTAERIRGGNALRDEWVDRLGYGRHAARYGERAVTEALRPFLDPARYESIHSAVVQWLDPMPGEAGAELGAGTGTLTALLAEAGGRMTAVEQSPDMLRVLRERLPHVEAAQGNLLALPFRKPRFRFAACVFALHSLDARQQLLAADEIDRVLLPGGRACLAGMEPAVGDAASGSPSGSPSGTPFGDALHAVDIDAVEARFAQLGYRTVRPACEAGVWLLVAVHSDSPSR